MESRFANINLVNPVAAVPALEWKSHAAEPIKRTEEIDRISRYLIAEGKIQDNLMFIMGINFGLRCSDLVQLRVVDIVDEKGAYRDPILVRERKTAKKKIQNADAEGGELQFKNREPRRLYVNDAVIDAFERWCAGREVSADDYLFPGSQGKPMSRQAVDKKFKTLINTKLGLKNHVSTHFLRKTFAYHFILSAPDRSRAIEYLQKAFGHSSPLITLCYAGITDDEIQSTVERMNLGHAIAINPQKELERSLRELPRGGDCRITYLYA